MENADLLHHGRYSFAVLGSAVCEHSRNRRGRPERESDRVDELVRTHWHLVDSTVRRLGGEIADRDEMLSAGYLALAKAAMSYDPARQGSAGRAPSRFATYAIRYIRYAVNEAAIRTLAGSFARQSVDSWEKLREVPLRVSLESPAPGTEGTDSTRTVEDAIADPDACTEEDGLQKLSREELWQEIRRILKPRQAVIVYNYYCRDKNLTEIGKALGLSGRSASNQHNRALQKLREKLPASLCQ